MRKMQDILGEAKAQIENAVWLGKSNDKKKTPRYLILTLSITRAYENIFVKWHKPMEICKANVIITQALADEGNEKEKRLLKRQFELINEGTKKMDIRFYNLRLFVKCEKKLAIECLVVIDWLLERTLCY